MQRINLKSVKLLGRNFSTYAFPKEAYLPREDVSSRVIDVVASFKQSPPASHIKESTVIAGELQFDSLLRAALFKKLSEEFCLDEEKEFVTISDAIDYYSQQEKAR
eukprot:gene13245-17751_t